MSAEIGLAPSESAWRRVLLAPVPASLLLGLALCTPLLLVGMPPLTDLPNHMVRMMLLAGELKGSAVASHYRVHWVFVPDLGMDLLVPPLLHVMSTNAAAKLLLAVIVVGWIGGLGFLGRALHGRWSPWFLTAAFTAWNGALLEGMINYCLSTMLAFWAAGWWLLLRRKAHTPRALIGLALLALPLGFVLFVAHLLGAFLFGALLGADALVRAWRERMPPADRMRRLAGALLPPAPAAILLAGLYETTTVLEVGGTFMYEKLGLLWHSVSSAWFSYPMLLGFVTGILLVLVLLRARAMGRVHVAPAALLVLLVSIVLGFALPFSEHGLAYINVRFQILAGVLVSVVFLPEFRERRPARIAARALGAMMILRLALMLLAWSRTGPYIANVRWIVAQIPPNARVGEVPLLAAPSGLSPWLVDRTWLTGYYVPVYIAAISDRFVPALFDKRGQQPLEALPAELETEDAMDTVRRVLLRRPNHGPLGPALDHFDLMVVVNTWSGAPPTLFGGRLVRIAERPGVSLYKVVPAPR